MYPNINESDAKDRTMKAFGPFQHYSSDNSTYAVPISGSFGPVGTIDYGVARPLKSSPAVEEQKGLTPVERAALELSMQRHRRAYDLLAQH